MSWSLHVLPLHHVAARGGWRWVATVGRSRGVPDDVPAVQQLPRVMDVLVAVRASGCHGAAWFEVAGVDTVEWLPPCPDPSRCVAVGGLDLGEVSVHVADRVRSGEVLRADAAVESLGFRKPRGAAVLRAVCAFTSSAGALLVCDDAADQVFVVWPQERAEDLTDEWPW